MSNIYIQEPPTFGKVLLSTTVGDIEIELWSKEAPKASRNFIQLCMESYYDGVVFHRLVKGFIVQGGDPTGTGMGGESIYGKPFRDEFHSRLRFVRRGLVAMANSGKDDNGSQFFFTLGASPELQDKHTIFGKVTRHTVYNMLKLEESLVDNNERPLYPHKIINTKVLSNPIPDIVPRVLKKEEKVDKEEKKTQAKGTKNFKLLSFGEEAEEEEAEVDAVAKGFRGKSKSSHDLTNDPKLSSVPAVDLPEDEQGVTIKRPQTEGEQQEVLDRIRKKLRKDSPPPPPPLPPPPPPPPSENEKHKKADTTDTKVEVNCEYDEQTKENQREKIRQEIKNIKKEIRGSTHKSKTKDQEEDEINNTKGEDNTMLTEFYSETEKFQDKKKQQLKGSAREEQTLAMLAKFQSKMQCVREKFDPQTAPINSAESSEMNEDDDDDDDVNDETWLAHTLKFEEQGPTIAKDANLKLSDRYDISDPRNPINERKREASKHSMKNKKH